jgi:hypothetical protein
VFLFRRDVLCNSVRNERNANEDERVVHGRDDAGVFGTRVSCLLVYRRYMLRNNVRNERNATGGEQAVHGLADTGLQCRCLPYVLDCNVQQRHTHARGLYHRLQRRMHTSSMLCRESTVRRFHV